MKNLLKKIVIILAITLLSYLIYQNEKISKTLTCIGGLETISTCEYVQ